MTNTYVKVYAPATIANLGPAFDVLGIAISRPGDYVIAERKPEPGIEFHLIDKNKLGLKASDDNVAVHVTKLLLEDFQLPFGVRLTLDKQMPVGSGLGSSGASSVAALVAVNALLPKPLSRAELLSYAMAGEKKASGSAHADNVAPALLGGACLVRSYDPLDVVKIPIRNKIYWVVVHPQVVVNTATARQLLPQQIALKTAVAQWGNVSGLTAGLISGDANLIGRSINDIIVEPVRAALIPQFNAVKQAALAAGAVGCSISGSGPAMFAATPSLIVAKQVAMAMTQTFAEKASVKSKAYISRANLQGAKIICQKP